MIKLICIDMDGTLYSKQKEIFQGTKDALTLAVQQGVQIAIVTGRPINYVMAYRKELPIDIHMAGSNGGFILIRDEKFCLPIQHDDVQAIIDILSANHLHMFLKSQTHIHTNMEQAPFFHYEELTKHLPMDYQMHTIYQKHLDAIEEPIYKIIVLGENADTIMCCRKQIHERMDVETFASENHHFELSAANANKGNAIRRIADTLHIQYNEIACIGDSDNDIPMFEACGFRIAMGNANMQIQEMCDYVTSTCEEDGVGKAIRYLYKKQWKP